MTGGCGPGLVCDSANVCERPDGSVDALVDVPGENTADALDAMDSALDVPIADTFEAGPMHYAAPTVGTMTCDDVSTGMSVPGALADNATSPIRPLPFGLLYFGYVVDHISIASNGYAQLWLGDVGAPGSDPTNVTIPNMAQPNGVVAALWSHLVPGSSTTIRSAVIGTAPNRHYTIEWGHWSVASIVGSDVTFQIKFFESSNAIEFEYCAITGGDASAHATIGLENTSGSAGIQFAYNMAAAVSTGTSLRFAPAP
jgi:hypothetical protein